MLGFNYWELAAVGVDVGVLWFLYRMYKNKVKDANIVESVPSFEVDAGLRDELEQADGHSLPYACVEGLTEVVGAPLKSSFTDAQGIIKHQVYVEHKSKRTQGFWSDVKRVIKDQTDSRAFRIVSADPEKFGQPHRIEVVDALSAEYLQPNLAVVYDKYEPAQDNLLSRSLDRIFGEVTKGYQETEQMLGIGVPILGIGKLTMDGNRMFLRPPDRNANNYRYIVTTLSKPEVVRSLKTDARTIQVVMWVLGLVGFGFFAYVVYRNVSRWWESERVRQMLTEVRRRRVNSVDRSSETAASEPSNPCVVCLANQREVVVLECGHICMCGECAAALPEPKLCPVCRSRITRFVPTYMS